MNLHRILLLFYISLQYLPIPHLLKMYDLYEYFYRSIASNVCGCVCVAWNFTCCICTSIPGILVCDFSTGGHYCSRAVLIIFHHFSLNFKIFENVSATVTRFELNFIHSKHEIVPLFCITMYHGVTWIVSGDRPALCYLDDQGQVCSGFIERVIKL